MRMTIGIISLLALVSSAQAAIADPHIIFATGGDATDLTIDGTSAILSPLGGGIFVFHNATGRPLSQVDINVQFPGPSFPDGFVVDGTVFVPSPGQQSTFSDTLLNGMTCDGLSSDNFSCLEMVFGMVSGPLIETDQNFVLDFYFPHTAVDDLVAAGNYNLANCELLNLGCTGTTNLSPTRSGEWPNSGLFRVSPVPTPEPGPSEALVLGGIGLAIYFWRLRVSKRTAYC